MKLISKHVSALLAKLAMRSADCDPNYRVWHGITLHYEPGVMITVRALLPREHVAETLHRIADSYDRPGDAPPPHIAGPIFVCREDPALCAEVAQRRAAPSFGPSELGA